MKRLAWLALAALALIPYLGAVHHPLLYDDRSFFDNRWLAREAGPVSAFQHDFWYGSKHEASSIYRPLTVLSLAWNMRAVPSKEGIRAVNVALHALATLMVAWMLVALAGEHAAWAGAALFALHPLGSESVLWAVGRAEICAAILGIAAFVLFVKLDAEEGLGGRRLALSAAAFLAALFFKESAAAWLALGGAWVVLSRTRATPAPILVARGAIYVGVFGAYLAAHAAVVGWGAHPPPFVDNPLVVASNPARAVNAILLFARYVAKMSWPRTLSVEYGFDQIAVAPIAVWSVVAAVAVVAAVVAAIVLLDRRGHAAAAFLVAFVPCAFAVTGNLAFPIGTIFGERLAYTPLIGFCGLAGLALAAIPKPGWRAAALSAVLLAGAWRTAVRTTDYRDSATLSEATAAASPRAVKALFNAARSRMRQGRPAEAVPLLERAVAIRPDYARARELLDQARAGISPGAPTGDDEGR